MKIERLRKSHKKEMIIGVVLTVVIGGALTFRLTHSKYRFTQSIDLAEGVIHYKAPDFQVVAMYVNDGDGDVSIDTVPTSGYKLNTEKSSCIVPEGGKNVNISYENGEVNFTGITKNKTKCTLYFEKKHQKM